MNLLPQVDVLNTPFKAVPSSWLEHSNPAGYPGTCSSATRVVELLDVQGAKLKPLAGYGPPAANSAATASPALPKAPKPVARAPPLPAPPIPNALSVLMQAPREAAREAALKRAAAAPQRAMPPLSVGKAKRSPPQSPRPLVQGRIDLFETKKQRTTERTTE